MLIVISVSKRKNQCIILDTDDSTEEKVSIDDVKQSNLNILGVLGDKIVSFNNDSLDLVNKSIGIPVVVKYPSGIIKQSIYLGVEEVHGDYIFKFYDESGVFHLSRRYLNEGEITLDFQSNDPVKVQKLRSTFQWR